MELTSIIVGIIVLALLFFIVKLAVRWAVRIAIVVLIFIILLGGGIFWSWSERSRTQSPQNKPPSPPSRHASPH